MRSLQTKKFISEPGSPISSRTLHRIESSRVDYHLPVILNRILWFQEGIFKSWKISLWKGKLRAISRWLTLLGKSQLVRIAKYRLQNRVASHSLMWFQKYRVSSRPVRSVRYPRHHHNHCKTHSISSTISAKTWALNATVISFRKPRLRIRI